VRVDDVGLEWTVGGKPTTVFASTMTVNSGRALSERLACWTLERLEKTQPGQTGSLECIAAITFLSLGEWGAVG
jgi:hypothetical protein